MRGAPSVVVGPVSAMTALWRRWKGLALSDGCRTPLAPGGCRFSAPRRDPVWVWCNPRASNGMADM